MSSPLSSDAGSIGRDSNLLNVSIALPALHGGRVEGEGNLQDALPSVMELPKNPKAAFVVVFSSGFVGLRGRDADLHTLGR